MTITKNTFYTRLRSASISIFLFILFSYSTNAAIFNAISDGNWLENSTWDLGSIPGASDTVVINGYNILYTNIIGIDSVSRIEIYNNANGNNTQLKIADESTLTVVNDVILQSFNFNKNIELKIQDQTTLNVAGDIIFERKNDNTSNGKLSLYMVGEAQMNVVGDFIYDYKNANKNNEDNFEIQLDSSTILTVAGNTYFKIADGKDFFIELKDSTNVILYGDLNMEISGGNNFSVKTSSTSDFTIFGNASMRNSGQNTSLIFGSDFNDGKFTVNGNLDIISSVSNSPVTLIFSGELADIEVVGDITFEAIDEGDAEIIILNESDFFLGGNILRPMNFGKIEMDELGSFTFNGENPQNIPNYNLPNSGSDSLNFSNLIFKNTSDEPIVLVGPMVVKNSLVLSNGNIKTSDSGILIMADLMLLEILIQMEQEQLLQI